MLAVAAGNTTVLEGTTHRLIEYPSANGLITSWLDWSDVGGENYLQNAAPRLAEPSGIRTICPSYIELDFLFISDAKVNLPTRDSYAQAQAFVNYCLEDENFHNTNTSGIANDATYPRDAIKLCTDILACSIELGDLWMASNGLVCGSRLPRLPAQVKRSCFDLWKAITTCRLNVVNGSVVIGNSCPIHISGMLIDEIPAMKDGLLHYLYFVLFHNPEMKNDETSAINIPLTKEYHATPTTEAGRFIMSYPSATILDLSDDCHPLRKAITTYYEIPDASQVRFAVSTAMNTAECATTRRLWALEPPDGCREWTIACKLQLFTFSPFQQDTTQLPCQKNQRIYGRESESLDSPSGTERAV